MTLLHDYNIYYLSIKSTRLHGQVLQQRYLFTSLNSSSRTTRRPEGIFPDHPFSLIYEFLISCSEYCRNMFTLKSVVIFVKLHCREKL